MGWQVIPRPKQTPKAIAYACGVFSGAWKMRAWDLTGKDRERAEFNADLYKSAATIIAKQRAEIKRLKRGQRRSQVSR